MKSKFNQERRDLLKSTCVMAGAAAVVSVTGSLPAFAADQKDVPMVGDVFVFTEGPKKGNVVMVADIPVDEFHVVMAQAATPDGKPREGDNCTAVLFRVSPDKVPADLKSESAEGIIAYSAVCTHQGCMMNEIHKSSEAVAAYGIICPCHDAIFDPLQGGLNTGGPKTRDIPQIPVKDDEGKLIVSDAIMSWIGVKR